MIPRSVRRMFDARSEPREEAGSQAVMLEFRNDLLLNKEWRRRVVDKLADIIMQETLTV